MHQCLKYMFLHIFSNSEPQTQLLHKEPVYGEVLSVICDKAGHCSEIQIIDYRSLEEACSISNTDVKYDLYFWS